jgi:CPA1 family monovalent cation:H+ antiporter
MGLDRLSKSDRALRGDIVAGTMRAAVDHVEELARVHGLPAEAFGGIRSDYEQRLKALAGQLDHAEVAFGDRLRTGLVILANQERRIVRRHYDDGVIGRPTMRALQRVAESMADAAIVGGRQGYQNCAEASVGFPTSFRFAMTLQRYFRIDRFLSVKLARRFHLLFEWEIVLRELGEFATKRLEGLIGVEAAQNLTELVRDRLNQVEAARRAMELQYPVYAQHLRRAFVERAALRWEMGRYDRFLREAIISPELHRSLLEEGRRRIERTYRPPALDPGFDRQALIDKVPIFKQLTEKERRRVARKIRTRLVMPGEMVADHGERGYAMYFIASGALEMGYGDERTLLGTGEFFGELAILRPTRRRKSQVVALGFCYLLELHREDVRRILAWHPELEEVMRAADKTNRAREWVPIVRQAAMQGLSRS